MFDNVPNMRARFTKFDATQSDDALRNDKEFRNQVNVIVGGLELLINSLNEPGQLQANLEKLVDDHLHMVPSVGLQYFGVSLYFLILYIYMLRNGSLQGHFELQIINSFSLTILFECLISV